MKIAVTYENGNIFQHFGHTAQFKVYEVENGKVVESYVVDTNGSGHGALGGFLFGQGVDVLICGGIGGGAQMALANAGIKLFGGVSGDADEAVELFLSGALEFNPAPRCNHHGHDHDHHCGENHHCGGHCGH
jgi:predicted Fe-Mo cluster-binding NifX family protein